jgi:Fe-S-cluster containining protein
VGAIEALAIYHHVHPWSDVDAVYRRSAENAAVFQRLLIEQLKADPRPLAGGDPRILAAHLAYNRLERPCPFLDLETGACRIYPVRPLVCRFFFSLSPAPMCSPAHAGYLDRDTRCIDPHNAIKARIDEIDRRLGLRVLNFLAGAFARVVADVLEGRPIRLV